MVAVKQNPEINRVAVLKSTYSQLRSDLRAANLSGMLPLAKGLREFFREQITLERANEEVKRALDNREQRFLELVRSQIYECSNSPYLKLLKVAGCDFSDLRTHVHRYGLEKTLERLAGEEVYLTADEFKGKKEVIRKGACFRVSPKDFERRDSPPGFAIQSSGSRDRPVGSLIPLDWLAVRTLAMRVFLSAHELFPFSHALYDAILPGSGVNHALINAKMGRSTDRWFARKVPFDTWLAGAYHNLTTSLIVLVGNWFGPGLPRPEFLEIRDLHRIVRWVEEKRGEGKACQISTIVSSAVRIARTALKMGASLEGTRFVISGEPYTESKRSVIEQIGAIGIPHYAYGGGVNVGFGCARPVHTDEIHVNQHMLAVIAHPRPLTDHGSTIHPLLCSTLHPAAPRVLLNVENGDYATPETRNCGCALGKVGLTLHLHHIRSFEKFTSEGMNYFYGDLFELLEKTLPAEFGGGPGDYQLVEEEDRNGQTCLTLLVHPDVTCLNEERLLARLREGLGVGSRSNRFMSRVWQEVGALRIGREVPHASPRGKILPLHIAHRSV